MREVVVRGMEHRTALDAGCERGQSSLPPSVISMVNLRSPLKRPRFMPIRSLNRTPNTVVLFGVFEADLSLGELRKSGVKVRIQDLPFRALKLLLSRPNEVITREEFRQTLWPDDVFVDFDLGIRSAIKRLRDALGDSAENPIFIETVDRRGYRWIAPTHRESTPEEAVDLAPEDVDLLTAAPAPASATRWYKSGN